MPTDDFGGEQPLQISKALTAIREGILTVRENEQVIVHETLVYTLQVNAAYLLSHIGIPDEARNIYRFEKLRLQYGPSFDGAQALTYGKLKFGEPRGRASLFAVASMSLLMTTVAKREP